MFTIIVANVFFGFITLLAACGELPKPFAQSSALNKNPLIVLDGGGAIKVEMDPALPVSLSKFLSKNMIESLWEENVPASTAVDFNPRYFLRGKLKMLNSSLFQAEEVEIIWALTEGNNKESHEFRYKLSGDRPGWLLLDQDPLDKLPTNMGKDVVRQLYKQQGQHTLMLNLVSNKDSPILKNKLEVRENTSVRGSFIPIDSLILGKKPKIFLTKVVGAPSDQNNLLSKKMRKMLIVAGANMVNEQQHSDFLLNGFVNVSQGYGSRHEIEITWLITTKDGQILGKFAVNKVVVEDTIEQEWSQDAKNELVESSIGIMNIITNHVVSGRD